MMIGLPRDLPAEKRGKGLLVALLLILLVVVAGAVAVFFFGVPIPFLNAR